MHYSMVRLIIIVSKIKVHGMQQRIDHAAYAHHVACCATRRMDEIGEEMCPVLLHERYEEIAYDLLQAICHEMPCFLNLSYEFHGSENSVFDTVLG